MNKSLFIAIGTADGFYFVEAEKVLPNGDYIYRGERYTAIEDEDDITTYRKVGSNE